MLTESRKRRHSCDAEELQVLSQAKRSGGYSFLPEVGRDVWDSESSSSDSSGTSSPERMAGATSNIQKTDQRGLHVSQAPCSPIAPHHLRRSGRLLEPQPLIRSHQSYLKGGTLQSPANSWSARANMIHIDSSTHWR